jgi:hypothetical protein
LYGIANGLDLEKCGRIGAIMAGKVIEMMGPKLDEAQWLIAQQMVGKETSG